MSKHPAARYSEIGCRIPKEYFWVIGRGESDVGIETGSYDAALHMAGMENYNVMLYTSVLPPETVELPHLPDIHHGSVLEGIIAIQHTDKPRTRITAGLLGQGLSQFRQFLPGRFCVRVCRQCVGRRSGSQFTGSDATAF
jgi:hypothetical protein